MSLFSDKVYNDYWLAIYYFVIMGAVIAGLCCTVIFYKDFDPLTDFEKRRRAMRKKIEQKEEGHNTITGSPTKVKTPTKGKKKKKKSKK